MASNPRYRVIVEVDTEQLRLARRDMGVQDSEESLEEAVSHELDWSQDSGIAVISLEPLGDLVAGEGLK